MGPLGGCVPATPPPCSATPGLWHHMIQSQIHCHQNSYRLYTTISHLPIGTMAELNGHNSLLLELSDKSHDLVLTPLSPCDRPPRPGGGEGLGYSHTLSLSCLSLRSQNTYRLITKDRKFCCGSPMEWTGDGLTWTEGRTESLVSDSVLLHVLDRSVAGSVRSD